MWCNSTESRTYVVMLAGSTVRRSTVAWKPQGSFSHSCRDCNQSRTQLRVWWPEPGAPTTLRRFSSHFIGYRCDDASLSSWRHWFTSAWTAEHLAIWPMTSVLPAAVVLAHGQPPVWCWTSLVRRRHWETEHLPSPDRMSEQPSSCHPWSVTVAVNLRKAADNLFVCLRVEALVTYELAPWICTD